MEKYSSFAHSCIGENHIKKGITCQDSSLSVNDNGLYSFASTADGHGSLCYLRTERGSKFAVECAQSCVDEFLSGLKDADADLDNEKERERLFDQLWRSIVSRWHTAAENDFASEPFTEEELSRIPEQFAYYRDRYLSGRYIEAYGTTLAFAVITKDFAMCMQIGDGSCVVLDNEGSAYEPVPEDPRCYDNVTTSMCQDDAALSYRYAYFSKNEIPAAVFLGTDGIENSYWNKELLYDFYRGLALTFCEGGMDEGVRQLSAFLPEMTRKGSGDDVSVSGIVDMERLIAIEDNLREKLSSDDAENPAVPSQPVPPDNDDVIIHTPGGQQ